MSALKVRWGRVKHDALRYTKAPGIRAIKYRPEIPAQETPGQPGWDLSGFKVYSEGSLEAVN
ncbi:unnamed protein product [marine sediment metagenome]|uniref:Uncharacterized protein n=1 Tax=marine sediment metagenome TaxID=412755 RepID=X1UG59_9ZZZZ